MYFRGGEQGRLELNIIPIECVGYETVIHDVWGFLFFPDEQKEWVTFWHRGPRHEFCSRVTMVRSQFSPRGTQANGLTSLSFILFICKMGMIMM